MTPTSAADRRIDIVSSVLLVVMWSSGFIGAALGTMYATPVTLLAWRFTIAGAILLVVLTVLRIRLTGKQVGAQVVIGLLVQAIYLGAVFTGVGLGVPAGTAALIAALQPLLVALVAGPMLGERTSISQRLGLLIGLTGVALVVAHDLGTGGVAWWIYLLPLGGMVSLAAGTLLQRRWDSDLPVVGSMTVQTCTTAVVFVAVALMSQQIAPPQTAGFWWSIAWMVVLASFGGLGSYIFVLRRQGATRVSTLLYLTPPTTMVWAFLMFGDTIGVLSLIGTAVCAVGVILAIRSPRPAPEPVERQAA